MKEFEIKKKFDELEGSEIKLNFAGRGPNSIEEELKLRKVARKRINEIGRIQTETKELGELEIETIEDNLLNDLNMEKGIGIEEVKKIEIISHFKA